MGYHVVRQSRQVIITNDGNDDLKNDPATEWGRIDIKDREYRGVRQARQVMIRNIGNADLRIDAVSVVYKDEVKGEAATRHRR